MMTVIKVDKLLLNDNQISKHLKIYIMKHLYYLYHEDIAKIKTEYLDMKKFVWIQNQEFSEILTVSDHK